MLTESKQKSTADVLLFYKTVQKCKVVRILSFASFIWFKCPMLIVKH